MAERTQFPSSPACGAWETQLTDALDGLLTAEEEIQFAAHKAICPACAALYEEARKGREWLEFLSPEPEAPEGLLERILARTGPGHAARQPMPAMAGPGTAPAFVPPVWQQPGFFARMRYALQPRLVMTASMAFFSIALTLNLAGVRVTSLRLADLRPRAVRSYMERQLNMASVPIVRYYDHLRFVYEVESRVRQLRSQSEGNGNEDQKPAPPATPGETKQNPGKNDGGGRLDPRQEPDNTVAQPGSGASSDFVETSFRLQEKRGQSDSSQKRARERGRVWIA
jgi:Putative zinc-finger